MMKHILTSVLFLIASSAGADELSDFVEAASERNCELTNRMITLAAAADALLYRAMLHDTGFCARLDAEAAAKLYNDSAKAGNAEAMHSIWSKMAQRVGGTNAPTKQERAEALRWLHRSGELKNSRAAWMLWQFYEYALYGYERDEAKAAYWKKIYDANKPANKKP